MARSKLVGYVRRYFHCLLRFHKPGHGWERRLVGTCEFRTVHFLRCGTCAKVFWEST